METVEVLPVYKLYLSNLYSEILFAYRVMFLSKFCESTALAVPDRSYPFL